jgi:hypothetical protein
LEERTGFESLSWFDFGVGGSSARQKYPIAARRLRKPPGLWNDLLRWVGDGVELGTEGP